MEKIKVLYIDDEFGNLNAFKASFRRLFDIYITESTEKALEILNSIPIEVIIADQKMPGKTGVEFFESILVKHPNPIRILLTAYSDIEAVIDSINRAQIFRYITKPWDEHDLKLTIENAYEFFLLRKQNNKLNLKYRKIFQESSDPILIFDYKGRIIDFNQSSINILQAQDNSLNFTSFSSIIHKKKSAKIIMEKLQNNELVSDFECQIISKKNVIRNCLISANTVKDNSAESTCYQVVIKDITEISKMNKLLLKTIIETQEAERKRIASDLHDGIGQSLAAIKLHLFASKPDKNEPYDENYLKIESLLEESIKQLRKICFDTLPTVLSEYGIVKAIKELSQKTITESFIINFNHKPSLPLLDKSLEIALYRIVQEFINNSLKHGNAKKLDILLDNESDQLLLNLVDDGVGFKTNELMNYKGQGLKNIRSRVESFNGKIYFKSKINIGTEFKISIPINLNEKHEKNKSFIS
jgi:PAS domain S-box-containing protein